VAAAAGLDDSRPVEGAAVEVALDGHELARLATGAGGRAIARFQVPRLAPGDPELRVRTRPPHGEGTVVRPVPLVSRLPLPLRADRPEYRPGQTVRWRVAVLNGADAHPLAELPVAVAVADPRGTEIWRGQVTTGRTGMVAGAIPLADDLILGTYT